jgi:hypothetical protein
MAYLALSGDEALERLLQNGETELVHLRRQSSHADYESLAEMLRVQLLGTVCIMTRYALAYVVLQQWWSNNKKTYQLAPSPAVASSVIQYNMVE